MAKSSGGCDLSESCINLQGLRDKARSELLDGILGSLKGSKCLVLDQSLGGPLNHVLVEGSKVLKDHGVRDFKELNWADLSTSCYNVIYLVRPQPKAIKQVISQIEALELSHNQGGSIHHYSLYCVPQRSQLCEQLLRDSSVYNVLKGHAHEFHLGLIPMDTDVLSMEIDGSLKQAVLHGDASSLMYTARALLQLQDVTGGAIPNIQVKGNQSKMVLDLMLRFRAQDADGTDGLETMDELGLTALDEFGALFNDAESQRVNRVELRDGEGMGLERREEVEQTLRGSGEKKLRVGAVDTLIMIDRQVDLVTPMCTALTYEALIDSLVGIKSGYAQIDSTFLQSEEEEELASEGGGSGGGGKKAKSKTAYALNSNDKLYREIRDYNITILMKYLNEKARQMKEMKEQVRSTQEVSELKEFVKQIPQIQQEMKSLSHHINITQYVSNTTMQRGFRERWHSERSIIEGENKLDYIEDCVAKQEPWIKVLCLLSMQSLVSNGIRASKYDSIRRDIVHAYGLEVVFTLDNLESMGFIKKKDGSSSWPAIRKAFKLIQEEVSPMNPDDIAYVTSGYAPLSVRLVELAISPGWTNSIDKLKLVPGVNICQVRQPGIEVNPATDPQHDGRIHNGKKNLVVFFTGGITFAEISALRLVSRRPTCPFNIIIATTKLINGPSLIQSVAHEMQTGLKKL